METYRKNFGKVWRYLGRHGNVLDPMNPTKWSNMLKCSWHLEVPQLEELYMGHESWVSSIDLYSKGNPVTSHEHHQWSPSLSKFNCMQMSSVFCCISVFNTYCFICHISGIYLGTCSPPCFKPLIMRLSFQKLLQIRPKLSWWSCCKSCLKIGDLTLHPEVPSWMRKRRDLLPCSTVPLLQPIHQGMTLPEPPYHGGNDATSKG